MQLIKKTPKNENTDKVIDIVEEIVKVACVVKIKLFFLWTDFIII